MAVLTTAAIILIDSDAHLLLYEVNGTAFEEACVGKVLGYDENGLIVQEGECRLRYLWKGINKITECPGQENHKEGTTQGARL